MVVAVAWLVGQFTEGGQIQVPAVLQEQRWEYLSDRPWEFADTSWLMMGNEGTPVGDGAFLTGNPLIIGDHVYGKGFGVFTPSEVSFQLQGAFSRLEGVVGVEPDDRPEPSGERRVRFLVYADGDKVLETPPLDVSQAPYPVAVTIRGVHQLRLVTEREPGVRLGARAMWADMRVQRELPNPTVAARNEIDRAARGRAAHAQRLADNLNLWDVESQQAAQEVLEAADGELPDSEETPRLVALGNRLVLVNATTAVLVGVTGHDAGRVSLLNRAPARYLAKDLTVRLADQRGRPLGSLDSAVAELWDVAVDPVNDTALGDGVRLSVPFVGAGLHILLRVTLFTRSPTLFVDTQMSASDESVSLPAEIRYVTSEGGAAFAGTEPHYLTNLVRLRYVPVHDDGLERRDYLGWSNPFYLYEPARRSGLLLAVLDETRQPPSAALLRKPVAVHTALSLAMQTLPVDGGAVRAPRLMVRALNNEPMQQGLHDYRRIMQELAPAPQLPAWLGPQWLSWYVYYMDITEELLVQQIDAIERDFGDLGPWHIIVDAGWYWAEGRGGAEWLRPDEEKFPRGLRWLVEYAHRRGVKVVLYFTGPYLNTNEGAGNWLGLRGIIDAHPDWVIPLDQEKPQPVDYVYDMANPELRSYLQRVFEQYWVVYGVDGMKLDGLGSAGESIFVSAEGADLAMSAKAIEQTLDLYRLVYEEAVRHNPQAYIESGWLTPTLANRFAHTFRYGDEETIFSRTYPLPGLTQHIDYTAYQQAALGQRSNIGAIWGEPNESVVNLWWLGAALALDAQVSVSLDMTALTPESVSLYRSFLAHYRPFSGVSRTSADLEQEVFSTNRDGTHYVGIVNRSPEERTVTVTAATLGLDAETPLAVFDTELGTGAEASGWFEVVLEPESFRLVVVRSEAGVLWSNVRTTAGEHGGWDVTGPPTVPGFVVFYVPLEGGTLYWDGLPLVAGQESDALPKVESLAHSSLVRVSFPSGGAHQLKLEP